MTSERSSLAKKTTRGMQREYTKRRLWLVALMGLYTLIAYLILPIIYFAQRKQQYSYYVSMVMTPERMASFMQEGAEHLLGFTFYYGAPVILIAIVFGIQGFMWLYKVSSVDFYESQPIRRSRRFCGMFFNGVLIYALMSLIGVVIALIVAAGSGAFGKAVLSLALLQWLRLLILFFGVYAFTVLAVLISKNVIIAVFVDALLLSVEAIYRELVYFLSNTYYATFYSLRYVLDTAEIISPYPTSPVVNHFAGVAIADDMANTVFGGQYIYTTDHMEKVAGQLGAILPFEAVNLLVGIAVFALAFIVYHYRKAESIGSGVIDSRIAAAIKLLVVIPIGAFVGMTVDTLFLTTRLAVSPMTIFLVIFAVAVVCLILETVDAGNIRRVFAHAWQIPIALALSFVLLYYFKADMAGYDRYLPDPEKVEDVALVTDSYMRDYYENGSYTRPNNEVYLLKNMHLTDVNAAEQVAARGQVRLVEWQDASEESRRDSADSNGMYSPYDDEELSGWYATIGYHMKDGRLICRSIMIPYDVDGALMDSLVATDEWRETIYQPDIAVTTAAAVVEGMVSYEAGYGEMDENMNIAGFEKLMSLYKKDLEKYSFTMASNEDPIGVFRYYDNYSGPGNHFWFTYPVYADYTETIGFLKEIGIYQEPRIPVERVMSMSLDYSESVDEGMTTNYYEYELTDPNDIAEIAAKATSNSYEFWHKYPSEDIAGVSFTLSEAIPEDEEEDHTEDEEMNVEEMSKYTDYHYPSEWYYIIPFYDIPDSVREELLDNLTSSYSSYEEY